jgi:hypothetical protein
MPTILRIGAYRFFFYSNEGFEPPHIHVQKDDCLAKFWLNPVDIASSIRFNATELNQLRKYSIENEQYFLEKWNEYFNH